MLQEEFYLQYGPSLSIYAMAAATMATDEDSDTGPMEPVPEIEGDTEPCEVDGEDGRGMAGLLQ